MKGKIILISLFLGLITHAQNVDSLFNAFVTFGDKTPTDKSIRIESSSIPDNKCAFGIVGEIKRNFNSFSNSQQIEIKKILARPVRQKSIVSPSGIFRIHFDTTGFNAPDYFPDNPNSLQLSVDSLAIAFDSSYSFEINYLGYISPPKDDNQGGDDLFDVYISQLGYYGVTSWELNSANKNASYIKVDNRMNFFTKGIAAARATAAHEFHHAVQVGNYSDNLDGNTFYFELTSTSMEEFVFDNVNDYYGYLSGYFNNPDRRFTYFDGSGGGGGYDRAVWNIFLKEKFKQENNDPMFGYNIIKRSWELMKNNQNTAMKSISLALSESGLSLDKIFSEFAQWSFFTDYRTKENKYFPEADNYPLIRPIAVYDYQPPKKTISISCEPMSNNFLVFDLTSTGVNDTLVSIITNASVVNADNSPYEEYNFDYSLLTVAENGSNEIVEGYYSVLTSEHKDFLTESNIFNNEIVNGREVSRETIDYVYPQPFNYAQNNFLFFPTTLSKTGNATLTVYSASMNLVYHNSLPIYKNDKIVVRWNGLDDSGNKISSGVYIFVTNSDGEITKGKFVVIRN